MASFWFLIALITPFMALPSSLSLPSQLKLETPTVSAVPAESPNPPLSPFTELSPDISPLLPSSGGAVPSPTGSIMPTIPSNPSPPNPDELVNLGPGSAISPSGSLPASSVSSLNLAMSLHNIAVFMGSVVYWSVLVFAM
ncbi:classical arabinogalactan protein 25 [Cornus florida]|uniref:classical arabinogalactan protein 25 n=1 Tax=Cornus florida TaxID=4283 RepID=UPI0028A02C4A|nr:classical arabinogalactan protein 25 [Cornus florida]